MQIIYLDTLFFLNTAVDYLLLLAAARVAGEPLHRLRFALSATVGGLYACGIFVFPVLQKPCYKVLTALLLLWIAYGKSHRRIRQSLIFLALSFAFAGAILSFSLLGGQNYLIETGVFYVSLNLKHILTTATVCYILFTILFQNFGKHSHFSGELVPILLRIGEKTQRLTALVDTGNTLQDPLTGQAVLVVEGRLLSDFFTIPISKDALTMPSHFLQIHKEEQTRLRLLPYQAVGIQGMLVVLKVDEITVNHQRIPETLVALSPTAVSDGGSYHALIGTINQRILECKS